MGNAQAQAQALVRQDERDREREQERKQQELEEGQQESEMEDWPSWVRKEYYETIRLHQQHCNLNGKTKKEQRQIKTQIFNKIKLKIERQEQEKEQKREQERAQWPEWARDKEQLLICTLHHNEYEKKESIFYRICEEVQILQREQEEQEQELERKQWPLWAKNMEKELLEQNEELRKTYLLCINHQIKTNIFNKIKMKIQEREEEEKEQNEKIKRAVRAVIVEMNLGGARNNIEPSAPPLLTDLQVENITEVVSTSFTEVPVANSIEPVIASAINIMETERGF